MHFLHRGITSIKMIILRKTDPTQPQHTAQVTQRTCAKRVDGIEPKLKCSTTVESSPAAGKGIALRNLAPKLR